MSDLPTAHDFPDCRPCQMWEDAGRIVAATVQEATIKASPNVR